MKKISKENKERIIALFALAGIAFLLLMDSPLHPWIKTAVGVDSGVFKTIAFMMERGCMPYRDSFDHKGPLLYILNYLGNRISYYRGIWVIEYAFMVATFYIMYRTARLRVGIGASVLTLLTAIALLPQYFNGGNLTEEYAMLFIATGLYIFLDYLQNDRISTLRIAVSGGAMGAVLLLRPNMITLWIVFCTAVLLQKLKEKAWKELGGFILWFTAGMLAVLGPVLIWLAVNGALIPCWRDYILFNLNYVSVEEGTALSAKWHAFFAYFNNTIYILSTISIFYYVKRNLYLNITYIVYMMMNLLMICMAGTTFGHYGMVLIPAFVYPVSILFENAQELTDKNTESFLKAMLVICFLSVIIMPDWIRRIESVPDIYEQREISHDIDYSIIDIVKEYSNPEDKISVYGNWDIIYVLSQRKHATRYSYQFSIGTAMQENQREYFKQLQEEMPPLIIVQENHYDDTIREFLHSNAYEQIWAGHEDAENAGARVYYHKGAK